MRKAALHNLGCKVNAYETEAMEQLLEAAGYEIVSFEEKADVYVINTCSVTNVADKKSRQMLHRAKAKNPDAVVVAAGCYVQAAADKLREDAAVDLIIGNNRKADPCPASGGMVCRKRDPGVHHGPCGIQRVRETSHQQTGGAHPAPSSRFRTAATSSAATASFRIREAASEAAGRRMWRRK